MRTFISIFALILVFTSVSAQQKNPIPPVTDTEENALRLSWDATVHDFKEIPLGEPAIATFEFTNDGSKAVSITKVRSSCGCTVADYTKEPILPGKTGQVTATYNAAKKGNFNKMVTVYVNGDHTTRLRVKGIVTE